MDVSNSQIDLLARLLDASSVRHDVIANNIANVNTPGYRQREVAFEDALRQHLDRGETIAQATRAAPQIVEGPGGADRVDGNNVDIDAELAALTKNTLLYRTYTQVIAAQLGQMRSAITGT